MSTSSNSTGESTHPRTAICRPAGTPHAHPSFVSPRWDNGVRRYVEVALALAELRAQGLVREIGLTNFALAQVVDVVCDLE